MKRLFEIFGLVLAVCMVALSAFAQMEILPPTDGDWAGWFADLLSGKSGLALGLVALQGIMLLLRSKLGEKAGKYRFLAVSGIALGLAVVGVLVTGKPWADVLNGGTVLGAVSVFMHQIVVQFFTKEGDTVAKSAPKV
jgi:hypothetical protein